MSQNKIKIAMYSSADKVEGQGVGSAYKEQVRLIEEGASDLFDVKTNHWFSKKDIKHFHTLDPSFIFPMLDKRTVNIAYCHFLPNTLLDGSIKVPRIFQPFVSKYIINFYNAADRLVVVNPSFIDELVAYKIPRDKIYYIPNYVSKEQFHSLGEEQKRKDRIELGINPDKFVVLGAGQVQTRKGVFDFVETAKKCPNIEFVWAGGFSFGKLTDGYEELKKIQDNPPENLHFIGIVEREKMVNIFNLSDILFMPSYNELFPMTILEAVNLELPLVLRNLDLYKDILFNKYIAGSSNADFIAAIQELSKKEDLYKKYQQQSKEISEYYSREHVLSMWKEFYMDAYEEKQKQLQNK